MIQYQESELVLNRDGSVYHLNLKPEHLSDIILTVGDPARVYKISQYFDDVDFEMNKREYITHIGKYKGKRITVISTGMGTDNIEILLTELDALASIDLKKRAEKGQAEKRKLKIIRIGTSGGLQPEIPLGSHLVSDYAIGLDTLMHFYDFKPDELSNEISEEVQKLLNLPFKPYCGKGSSILKKQFAFDMIEGNTLTAPGFYAPQGRRLRLPIKYPNLIKDLIYFRYKNFWLTNFEMETAGYYTLGSLLGHEILSVNAIIANRTSNTFSKDPDAVVDELIKKVLDRI